MPIVERHTTPDGLLTLIVDHSDGDWSIGFDGYSWHTHGDILQAWGCSGSPEEATRLFIDRVISSQVPICVYRLRNSIVDVVILSDYDDPPLAENLKKYGELGESVEVRSWHAEKS